MFYMYVIRCICSSNKDEITLNAGCEQRQRHMMQCTLPILWLLVAFSTLNDENTTIRTEDYSVKDICHHRITEKSKAKH